MLHAVLELRIPESVARHMVKLVGPGFLKVAHFAGSHNDGTGQRQNVVLKELELLKDKRSENLTVIREMPLGVILRKGTIAYTVGSEENALALEVAQYIIERNELNLPAQSLEHVFFLGNEVVV